MRLLLILAGSLFLVARAGQGRLAEKSDLLLIQVGAAAGSKPARPADALIEERDAAGGGKPWTRVEEESGLDSSEENAKKMPTAATEKRSWKSKRHKGSGLWKAEQLKKARYVLSSEGRALPVDIKPEDMHLRHISGRNDWMMAPTRSHRFRFLPFVRQVMESARALRSKEVRAPTPTSAEGEWYNHAAAWSAFFLFCLLALGSATWWLCSRLHVELPPALDPLQKVIIVSGRSMSPAEDGLSLHEEAELVAAARGRPVWSYACVVICFLLSTMVFAVTVVAVGMVNHQVLANPEVVQESGGKIVVVTRFPISEPTKSGYEAGMGVAFSVAAASVLTFAWRWRKKVAITLSLLAQFALRGATLSLFIAIVLELLGEMVLQDGGVETGEGFNIGNALMMIVVGASEETAKLLAVVLGTYASASALSRSRPSACCGRFWHVLVENRRALILAGFAVGFGFMINENAEYMMATASSPPMRYANTDGEETDRVGESALATIAFFTIMIRVLFNTHPWWCGISAARVAKLVYSEHRGVTMPSVGEFLWAIAPSALAHAAYDFVVSGGAPALFAMLAPPGFWMVSRWIFMDEWARAEETCSARADHETRAPGSAGAAAEDALRQRH
eukprot:TRINITY_DN37111_c0_g1_i1.p1 TRINITY_DN37111_c0_g1~~TRINITY_DN37111_c0_g1_i1.p1  ORF type:complete len:646 (+),score=137.46 TRINITY_DN37111_c0_g1_i1:80-1939(+)